MLGLELYNVYLPTGRVLSYYLPLETVQYDKVKKFHRSIFVNNSFLEVVKVTFKMIYNIHIDKLFKTPTSKLYYSNKFNVTEDDWLLIYTLAGKLTLDSKLRVFQYKVLNNILYLNKSLYEMKLADAPLCTFCQREEEIINHLFPECEYSKTLWSEIQNWLKGDLPNINSRDVVLGFVLRLFCGRMENVLLLLYKRFIYIKRLSNKPVRFERFKVKIESIMKVEEKIASKSNKLPQHFQKWDLLGGRLYCGMDRT